MPALRRLASLLLLLSAPALADETLIDSARTSDGAAVPYILTAASATPKYLVILFPGGTGIVDPHLEDGRLVYRAKGNFLVRSRQHLVDEEFAAVLTDSTHVEPRIQAVLDDLRARFPAAKIYLAGTSNGTFDSMALAGYLQDRIAGEIHTSSLSQIGAFDARKFRNRHLVVHHRNDGCRRTPFYAAFQSHERYGNDFIEMTGGISNDDACEAFAYHGYNGIEKETMAAIKDWIRKGDRDIPQAQAPR